MIQKPLEYWLLIAAVFVYLVKRAATLPWYSRLLNGVVGAAMGVSLSESLASWAFGSEPLAAVVIMLIGESVLDVVSTLAADRKFWRDNARSLLIEWARKRVGVDPKGGDDGR